VSCSIKPWPLVLLVISLALPAAAGAAVEAGQEAPAISLPVLPADVSREFSLASLRGKVVYLDFWASWCGPCRLSFPQLEQLRGELGPRGFEVLAVSVDEVEEDALRFLEELPVSYPVVLDSTGETPGRYGILGMPTGYLIDRAGVVRLVHQGYRKSDGEKLRAEILDLLEE
jgi:thiol-disulfide isomerase/thioredoxin